MSDLISRVSKLGCSRHWCRSSCSWTKRAPNPRRSGRKIRRLLFAFECLSRLAVTERAVGAQPRGCLAVPCLPSDEPYPATNSPPNSGRRCIVRLLLDGAAKILTPADAQDPTESASRPMRRNQTPSVAGQSLASDLREREVASWEIGRLSIRMVPQHVLNIGAEAEGIRPARA